MIINIIPLFLQRRPLRRSLGRAERERVKKKKKRGSVAEGHMTCRMPTRLPVGSNSDESETAENTQ